MALAVISAFGLAGLWPALAAAGTAPSGTLRSGWYPWEPYQFLVTRDGTTHLTGLDIKLARAVAQLAGFKIAYKAIPWKEHLYALRDGSVDMAAGATFNKERAGFAYYSIPYRSETDVLYLPWGAARKFSFHDVAGLVAMLRGSNFRLGVIDGFVYADDRINTYINDPANAARIVRVKNDEANFRNLVAGRVDGVLADRVEAETVVWRNGWRDAVEEYPMQFSTPIHFIFSKASVTPQTVTAFNDAIRALKASGEYGVIVSHYAYPVMLAQTVDRRWFRVIEVLGIISFSLAGSLLAYWGRYDVFGALVLGTLPSLGGGVMRDLISGRSPLAIASTPIYLETALATVAAGFVFLKLLHQVIRDPEGEGLFRTGRANRVFDWLLTVFDAGGLGAFTVAGVIVAVATHSEPLWLWGPLLATLSGAGGGVLRDVVRQDSGTPTLKGELYPEIALVWGLLLSLFLIWETHVLNPQHIHLAILVTMIGAFLTRIAVVRFRIRSPLYG